MKTKGKPKGKPKEPGAGSWELGAGSQEPGVGSRKPKAGTREPKAGQKPVHGIGRLTGVKALSKNLFMHTHS